MRIKLLSNFNYPLSNVRGFTFIEVILYVSLVTVLVSALIPFAWGVIGSSAKSGIAQDVYSQARYASERIKYEIRNATLINSASGSTLSLNTPTNANTIIDLSGGKIRIRYGLTATPFTLNGTTTTVTALTFTNNTSADFKTQNVQYSFVMDDSLNSSRQEYKMSPITIQGSAEVRTPLAATPTPTLVPTATPIPSATPTTIPSPTPTSPPAWRFRKMITIQDAKVMGSTNFSNFTLGVILSGDTDLSAHAQTSGNDIKFTASDGVTKLNHEIEQYTSSNGKMVAWVKIPTLNAAANTIIYMYYGNTTAPNQQAPCTSITGSDCAWDGNYKGVWHLNEASNTKRIDSTANNNDLTDINTNTARVTAKIGNGATFNGSSALGISDTAQKGLDITGALTIEGWFDLGALGATRDLAAKHGAVPEHGYQLRYNLDQDRFTIGISTDGSNDLQLNSSTTGLTTNVWYHGVGTYDGSNLHLYLNGADEGSESDPGGIFNNDAFFCIGGRGLDCDTQDYIGMLDEIRVSNVTRSAAWIQTEYNNMSSPSTFYTLGAEEVL